MKTLVEEYSKLATAFLLEKEGVPKTRKKTFKLKKGINFENNKITYKSVLFGSYDENCREIFINRVLAQDKKGLNVLLKHPSYPSNATIIVSDGKNIHKFFTDSMSRVIKVSAIIRERNTHRVANEQTKGKLLGDEKGYVDTCPKNKDQGGHRIACSAGGIPEVINIYPQAYYLNNSKCYRDFERECSKAVNNGKAKIEIEFTYADDKRPVSLRTKLNGVHGKSFHNENSS